jgi:hypothetical protein
VTKNERIAEFAAKLIEQGRNPIGTRPDTEAARVRRAFGAPR